MCCFYRVVRLWSDVLHVDVDGVPSGLEGAARGRAVLERVVVVQVDATGHQRVQVRSLHFGIQSRVVVVVA